MAHVTADRVRETSTTTGTGALTLAGAVAGFRTFGSVMANADTAFYVVANRDAAEWEVGLGTWNTGGTLTRSTVLSSSNAGALVNFSAGTKDVHLTLPAARAVQLDHQLAIRVPLVSTDPPETPPADVLTLYARKRAGRMLPVWVAPSGVENAVQPQLWGNRVMLWLPGSGTGIGSFGLTPTTGATLSHPAPATTTIAESMYRTRFATSTTAGNAAGVRDAVNTIWRGNSAGRGGFFAHFRFCSGNISLAGGQKFIGLSSSTAALGGEPSALADVLGVGKDIADTQWQFMRRAGTGTVQKVSLGVNVANNQAFDLFLYSPPNGSAIFARVTQLNFDGTSTVLLDTSYTTDIPANTTLLGRQCQVRNGATAAADNFDLVRSYLESDF